MPQLPPLPSLLYQLQGLLVTAPTWARRSGYAKPLNSQYTLMCPVALDRPNFVQTFCKRITHEMLWRTAHHVGHLNVVRFLTADEGLGQLRHTPQCQLTLHQAPDVTLFAAVLFLSNRIAIQNSTVLMEVSGYCILCADCLSLSKSVLLHHPVLCLTAAQHVGTHL